MFIVLLAIYAFVVVMCKITQERTAKRKAEQKRLAQEMERQAKEQARQAKEQARQAEQLAKQEERIARLEQRIILAEREIAHYQPIVDDLRAEADKLSCMVTYYESKGLPCGGYKTQLERVSEKLYRFETKVIKAELSKQAAQQKLTA